MTDANKSLNINLNKFREVVANKNQLHTFRGFAQNVFSSLALRSNYKCTCKA